jgi:molybdenum cofactor cytidylyltransferase
VATLNAEPVAIVLAAGASARLGEDKLFLPLGPRRLLEHTLRTYRKATRVKDVVLVVPADRAERFEEFRTPTVHLATNPDPSRGMISSIRAGLASGWAQERDFLVTPADVPFVPPEIVDRIVSEFWARSCKIVLPTFEGLGGHPGMYAQSLRDEFFRRGDTQGAREVLARHRADTVRLHVPEPDVCFDVDTPEDLEMALDPARRWARVSAEAERKRRPYAAG